MPRSSYGSGTLFKRGDIWYLSYWVNGRQVQKSSRSTNIHDVKRLRNQLLGKKARGEMINAAAERITCGELLDDLIEHAQENVKESTAKIWKWCIGGEHSALLRKRQSRPANDGNAEALQKNASRRGRSETTCNRELSILRIALNLGRKCTPPKVNALPYFPMVREENVRHGFLTDGQYAKLRDVLPDHLKPLFVTAYFTGIRLGELLAWQWDQVDWKQGFVTLNAEQTKTGHGRAVPILKGAMRNWLAWARHNANGCAWVFNRIGEPIKTSDAPGKPRAHPPVFPIASSTICAAPLFATCAEPVSRRLSVCASPGTGLIRWNGGTTSWTWRTFRQQKRSWNVQSPNDRQLGKTTINWKQRQ